MTRNALAGLVAVLAMLAGQAFAETPRPKQRPGVLVPASAQMPATVAPLIAPVARPVLGPEADPGEQTKPSTTAAVQSAPTAAAPRDPNRGAVSNLPLPRYVTLKTNEGNARRGPGLTHRIDWVFTRAGMPMKITAEHGHWRRVEDAEGLGGWVHYSLLSGVRSVLIKADMQDVLTAPRPDGQVSFRAEAGVIARVLECSNDWCRISVDGEKGWAPSAALWGVDPGEVVE